MQGDSMATTCGSYSWQGEQHRAGQGGLNVPTLERKRYRRKIMGKMIYYAEDL